MIKTIKNIGRNRENKKRGGLIGNIKTGEKGNDNKP